MASKNKQASTLVSKISDIRDLGRNAKAASVTSSRKISPSRKKVATASMNLKYGSSMGGAFSSPAGAGSSFGGGYMVGQATNMYSPHLSPDFLELPQDLAQKRSYYRHFYNNDEFVGQAIDLHTELPLSKLRLSLPKGKDPRRNREILRFFEAMIEKINLLSRLIEATREYYVIGEAFIFGEDSPVEIPEEVHFKFEPRIGLDGTTKLIKIKRPDSKELEEAYTQAHYKGWDKLLILPPDQVHVEGYQFSDEDHIELIPDGRTQRIVANAVAGDPLAIEQFNLIPKEIRDYLEKGQNIPLDTNPHNGSFVYQLARAKPSYQDHGVSVLQRCMRTLVYRDKLRQAQTSIASRAMTPKRLIYAEDLDENDVEELRDQVDMALLDPDYSIIANYQVNWEEVSADSRLLNLSGEYDYTNRLLFAGLGVTESMLTGESSYSGERINIEIINNRYLLYREMIQEYVHEKLFKPVAIKKGFFEYDEFGNRKVLYPQLSFTRLAVRDNRDTFDSLFNLYQKGSLSIDFILELFNLDPETVRERLERDLFTVNDATFNEAIRTVLQDAGRGVIERSDFLEKFVEYLNKVSQFDISYQEPAEDDAGRF